MRPPEDLDHTALITFLDDIIFMKLKTGRTKETVMYCKSPCGISKQNIGKIEDAADKLVYFLHNVKYCSVPLSGSRFYSRGRKNWEKKLIELHGGIGLRMW